MSFQKPYGHRELDSTTVAPRLRTHAHITLVSPRQKNRAPVLHAVHCTVCQTKSNKDARIPYLPETCGRMHADPRVESCPGVQWSRGRQEGPAQPQLPTHHPALHSTHFSLGVTTVAGLQLVTMVSERSEHRRPWYFCVCSAGVQQST